MKPRLAVARGARGMDRQGMWNMSGTTATTQPPSLPRNGQPEEITSGEDDDFSPHQAGAGGRQFTDRRSQRQLVRKACRLCFAVQFAANQRGFTGARAGMSIRLQLHVQRKHGCTTPQSHAAPLHRQFTIHTYILMAHQTHYYPRRLLLAILALMPVASPPYATACGARTACTAPLTRTMAFSNLSLRERGRRRRQRERDRQGAGV